MKIGRRYICLLLPLLLVSLALAATQMQSVQIKSGKLRSRPSFLGKVVAEVHYGDRLTSLESRSGWTQVRDANGREGWIHTSALTEKKIVLAGGDQAVDTSASSDELALAGKGFNEEVESQFKTTNPDIDYSWVDRMERIKVTPEQAVAFLNAGDVQPKGGE
jgi:uncharacterized protein YgiM (DUF1202 family)